MPSPPAVIWIRYVAGAINRAGTHDCNVRSILGRNQGLVRLIHPIDKCSNKATVVVGGLQSHTLVNIQVDVTFQRERSGHIDGVLADHAEFHGSTALRCTSIDGILNRGGVVSLSIPDRPEAERTAERGAAAAATGAAATATAGREQHE